MKREGYGLQNVRIAKSDLTGNIYLARFGKDPNVALDKRVLSPEEKEFLRKLLAEAT